MRNQSFFNRPTLPPISQGKQSAGSLPSIPKQIGPYPIECLLAKGGMSLLYLGSHPETKASIAIKVLSPQFVSHPDMKEHFLKEAEIIAMADHPNIIKLHGYGEWENGLYIAMEYIEGISLREHLLRNPISLKKALDLILEISYALCHLHTHGVIHRDLKPENILINEEGHVKVIDFGIAQLLDPEAQNKEKGVARMMGTPVYMSPEQRANPFNASYPSDIYSLGIISYELILGKLCHGQIHLSLMPKGLQEILGKTLKQNPNDRYLDIVDFIADISSYLHSGDLMRDRKFGEQTGILFEKFQGIQQKLISKSTPSFKGFDSSLFIHKPTGATALYAEHFPEHALLVIGYPPLTFQQGILEALYLKGVLDALVKKNPSLEEIAQLLDDSVNNGFLSAPFPFLVVQSNDEKGAIHWLSCGAGSFWLVDPLEKMPREFPSSTPSLGNEGIKNWKEQSLVLPENGTLIYCTESNTNAVFRDTSFKELLLELQGLERDQLGEALCRKAKAHHLHYFDACPLVILTIHKRNLGMEKKEEV